MPRRHLDNFIEESRTRQRNIDFPDTVRNARSVDAFFWNGSPNPTMVQRIAAWLFGSVFLGFGMVFGSYALAAYRGRDLLDLATVTLMALFLAAIGIRTLRNGFRRPKAGSRP
jgi:hypothetical protein